MGRSRAAYHAGAADDLGQSKHKRKKTSNNGDSAGGVATGINDLEKALYHCNYCNKDISGNLRVKCVNCSDFDLCIECFSVGAEVHPHKSSHPYRIMDNLAFPLICADWNADEEMLLLEGIEMYGLGNWNQVGEHVGTKNRSQCVYHYDRIYMDSPCFPLPDMSHVMGKSREDLLSMAREEGCSTPQDISMKEEVTFPSTVKIEDISKEDQARRSSSSKSSGISKGASDDALGNDTTTGAIKGEDRSVGEKKPRTSDEGGVSLKELSGYNFKRQEFEIEYDNDAEQLLADMEFKDTDTEYERQVKLQVLQIYSKRLDERKRRKNFILDRNMLVPAPFRHDLTAEEKELCRQYRVFMRFHSKEDHNNFLDSIVEHGRIVKRIQELQEARAAGCRTSAEARKYVDQKSKKGSGESARIMKESPQSVSTGNHLQNSDQDIRAQDSWDITGFLGSDLLSDAEKKLCAERRILPIHYLDMLQTISAGIAEGNITKKADAHELFHVDPEKVDEVYELLITRGFAQ